ncbi:DUF6268 family outer membrane beta-barrel protein [Flagellimonas sp. DF-77]|uniref:DUF6268 family outer membrane beta-barrel protein n=1 Tax=Flagellimonas algarum TaxID=3230298 RepID=UPI0033955677
MRYAMYMGLFWMATFSALGQEGGLGLRFGFDYGTAPSLGNHYLETYSYALASENDWSWGGTRLQLAYTHTNFSFFQVEGLTNPSDYEKLHRLDLALETTKKLGADWALFASLTPQLASDLSGSLSEADFVWQYGFQIEKSWQKTGFRVGVERNTRLGAPRFVPMVAFWHRVNSQLTMRLGFPESRLSYTLNERHSLSATAEQQGTFYHIGNGFSNGFGQSFEATRLVFSQVDLSLRHHYKLQERIEVVSRIGLLATPQLEVETLSGTDLLDFEPDGSVFFSMGLTYNLN